MDRTPIPHHYQRGRKLQTQGDWAGAQAAYQQHLNEHPEDLDCLLCAGLLYKQQAQHHEAASAFGRYLALRDDIHVRNVLVTSLFQSGDIAQARYHGRINLEKKDAQAQSIFQRSALRDAMLRPRTVRFNPQQPQRNIIAFSLWGSDDSYTTGAIVNAQLCPYVYPGWMPRFYCDDSVPPEVLSILKKFGAQVHMVQGEGMAHIKPMWRFLASDDPNVDYFLCRDTDARLNIQEANAVHEWITSGQPFHVMRDHIFHLDLILAGMWGGVAGVLPPLQQLMLQSSAYFDARGGDQEFLKDLIWPLIKSQLCTHDSAYDFHHSRPYPAGFQLTAPMHIGGGAKYMPHWSRWCTPQG